MSSPKFNFTQARILIIDDDVLILEMISAALEKIGAKVFAAQDGTEGIAKAYLERPDLILLDIVLPDISGFEICRILKDHPGTQEIPIIFLTALEDMPTRLRGFQVGGVDYVTKPLQVEELLARLGTHLNLRYVQKKLAEKTRHFEGIFNTAAICIGFLNVEGRYQEVNNQCLKLFGYTREEMLGRGCPDLVHPEDRGNVYKFIAQLWTGEIQQSHFEKRFVRKDGSHFPGDCWLSALREPEGGCTGIVCVLNDLSARR